jgi:hypothetical protein
MGLSIGTPTYWPLPQARGGLQIGFVDLTFDASYATGGEPIVYSDIPGLDNSLVGMTPVNYNIKTWQVQYDGTAKTLVANAVGAEAAGDADLEALTVTMMFLGY